MTRDELMKRMVLKEGKTINDRTLSINRRTRGNNYIEKEDPHPAEQFDDFFDYEKELTELTPARNTVMNDIDQFTDAQHFTPFKEDDEKDSSTFVIMEKIPAQIDEINNIKVNDDSSDEHPFEFIRCEFVKEDGDRCKKQAKKGQEYCGIHKRYIERNS